MLLGLKRPAVHIFGVLDQIQRDLRANEGQSNA
jgi:hypothetical protein